MIKALSLNNTLSSDFFGENHFMATFTNIFGPVA